MITLNVVHADMKIVASPMCEVEAISKNEIKKIFMLKQQVVNGESIKIVDRMETPIYKEFIEDYMNKSLREMKTYWIRMLFTGQQIEPEKLLLEELNSFDNQESCYLSYINKDEKIDMTNWKFVKIK